MIFYPRFFVWINLFLLNHILLYSLLFPFQSIQTYVARVPVFWMVYFVCIFSSFRVFCIKVSRRRRKTVLVPQTNFLRLWHGKKNPWRYALKYFKTIQPRTFLCLPCWQRLTFIATIRSSIFIAQFCFACSNIYNFLFPKHLQDSNCIYFSEINESISSIEVMIWQWFKLLQYTHVYLPNNSFGCWNTKIK